jgi:sugar lactone lactonase YvrE
MDDMTGAGWTAIGERQFSYPVGVCLEKSGRLLVTEQRNDRIVSVDPDRPQWTTFRPPEIDSKRVNKFMGSWVTVDTAGRIYITVDGEHRVMRMDNEAGTNRVPFGTEGSGEGQFRHPAGVCVDARNRICVADFDNFRIVRIDDITGAGWTAIGRYGAGSGEFINPCGICLDDSGHIYVADQGNDRIVRMDDMTGAGWVTIGSFGTDKQPGKLYAPSGICTDRAGRIYVTESSSNHRVIRMDDMTGANWTVLGTGGAGEREFASPMGICVQK